jgi:hypothetical protein
LLGRSTCEQQAIKRLGQPGDITGAVSFLTSETPPSSPARPSS